MSRLLRKSWLWPLLLLVVLPLPLLLLLPARAALAPDHPFVLYQQARALALAGRTHQALDVLDKAGRIGVGVDPARDSAFASLRSHARFALVRERLLKRAQPLVASETALVVRTAGLIPENIAPDPATRGFFVGDLLGRRVLRVDLAGHVSEFAGPLALHGAVLGMKVDAPRGLLWVNVWSQPGSATDPAGAAATAALIALDLVTGEVRHRALPPDSLASHLFNDLVLTAGGEILLTDSEACVVYRLARPGDTLRIWYQPPAHTFSYPNGIALDEDARTLYVAHQGGVTALDLTSRSGRLLKAPPGFTLTGIDGLYRVRDVLVAVQNEGLELDRVTAFSVRAGEVRAARELERRHPAYHVPSTGAIVGGDLYYIGNAQLDRLDGGKLRDPGRPLEPIVILKLRIPASL